MVDSNWSKASAVGILLRGSGSGSPLGLLPSDGGCFLGAGGKCVVDMIFNVFGGGLECMGSLRPVGF